MSDNVPLLYRKELFGGTQETTPGTQAAVAAAMVATHVFNPVIDEAIDMWPRPVSNSWSPIPEVAGQTIADVSFETEFVDGDQTIPLFLAAGFKIDVDALTYRPTTDMSVRKTWSFAYWTDGNKRAAYGCALDLDIVLENGKAAIFQWKGRGIFDNEAAEAMPANPAYSGAPIRCAGMTLTLAGAAIAHPQRVVIHCGNDVQARPGADYAAASSGIAHFYVASRRITIEVDPETQLSGALDDYALKLAGTTVAFVAVLKSAAGVTKMTLNAPAAQRIAVRQSDANGRRVNNLTLLCARPSPSVGDDEFTMVKPA